MKKLLAIFLFALMLCTLIPFATVSATEAEPTIELFVDVEEVEAGDEFEVTVNLLNLEDTAGLIAALVEIGFDTDVFEAVTYFDEDEEMWVPKIEIGSKYNATSNKYIEYGQIYDDGTMKNCLVKYMRATAKETQVRREVEFCTITLKVKDDAASGTYDLEVIEKEGIYYGGVKFEFATINASITVNGADSACEHEYKYDCDKVCAKCSEETRPEAEHEYFYACDKVCMHCGELTNPDAAHSMIYVEAKAPTCTEDGNIEHWYCEDCGGYWDNENAAGMPLSRYMVTLNAQHDYTYACDAHCAICHELTNEDAKHNIIHVEAVDATCDENGNIEYWYCEICGSAWADEGLTQVTNVKSVILPAGHSFLNGIRGTQLSVGDCVTPATYATKCDRCDVEDKTKVITGETNPANHAGKKFFEDTFEDMSQHLVYCNKCGELWDSQNPSAPHEANEEGYCECGLFAVVQDFNGGQISTKPPYPEMTEEAWTYMVESQLGGFDVTSMSRFTHGLSIIVKDENIAMMNLMFVKEGYKLVGLAYDAEGTQRYNGENIEKPTTLYYVWEPLHTHAHDHYDITETTHQSICSCGEILGEAEEHDYTYNVIYSEGAQPNTHHKEAFCVCDAHEMSDAEHTDANADGSCDECELHTCVIELVDGKPATCTEDGWYSYGYCEGCGTYYTYEAEREQFYHMTCDFEEWKAGEGKIPATGHSGYYYFEFYVDGSFCTVEMSFYCTTCEKIVGDPMAYNDEGMLYTGAFCNRTGVLTKTFSFKYALPENCSWDNFELKGELPETPNFINIWEEETATLIYGWATPLDPNNHWSREVSYQNITDEQHTVYHPCCEATETVDHTFDETTHKCVCGKVETFTLTISYMGNELKYTIPYGAKVWDYIEDDFASEGELFKTIRVKNEYMNGSLYKVLWTSNDEGMVDIDKSFTMPDSDTQAVFLHIYDGWHTDENGTYYNYFQGSGWYYIEENYDDIEGGAWYYIDPETGYRVEGLTRVPYPTVVIEGTTYGPDQEAIDYAAGKGQTFIDAESALFLFGADGKFQFEVSGLYEGHVYSAGMQKWHPGLIEIDGEYYYFIGDVENGGNIAANGDTYITRNNGNADFVLGEIYFFVNGKLSTKNGVVDGYYYENGQLMIGKGLVQLDDGRWIYVRSNGAVATGVYYVGEQKWEFDENGYAKELKNGIIGGKYYVNGHVQYGAGLVQYENGYIYVCSNGQVVMGRTYWITNTNGKLPAGKYEFGADGKLLPVKDGIVEVEGVLYYYDNNHVQYGAGLVEIEEGVYIYVRSNGQLAIGEYWVTNHNDLLKEGKYTFGNDGKLTVN